jgi:hypothetical protein
MVNLKEDGWDRRLAVLRALKDKVPVEVFVKACGTSVEELDTATDLEVHGTIVMATGIDYSEYEALLGINKPASTTETVTAVEKPVTATKPEKVAKKRGRKGDKIKNAFAAIPSTPVDAEEFIAAHGISMAVMRQSKRFDNSGIEGAVHVRKNKEQY